jgi:hypothetical protein
MDTLVCQYPFMDTRYLLLHPNMPWHHSTITSVLFSCLLKHLCYLHMENTHLVKIQHLGLSRNLGLFPTFKWVGLTPVADFPSGPRLCRMGLPSFISWPKCKLCLIRGFNTLRTTPRALFLKTSFADIYANPKSVKLRVEPIPTFDSWPKLLWGLPHGGMALGPNWANPHI